MIQTILPDRIRELLEQHEWRQLARLRYEWPDPEIVAPEIADLLLELEKPDRVLLFRALPRDLAVEVFSILDPDTADGLLLELTDQESRRILEEMNPDDRTALLEELPGQATQRILSLLSPEEMREARRLLGYPEDSVGRLMTPDYVAVRAEWTVGQALQHIRKNGHESETLHVIYVTDAGGKLIDALPLQRFVFAPEEQLVSDLMDYSFVSIEATEHREEAVRAIERYDRVVLPVTDSKGILVGIVTVDDVIDVSEEEVTEDFQRVAAIAPLPAGYFGTSWLRLFGSRVPWLAVLVVVNLLSSGVIAAYEETLAAYVALAFFIPLIIDTGGNAGSQSATLMIRALSTGEIELRDWYKVLLREFFTGLAIGVVLGGMGLLLGTFRGGAQVGLVVFLTMTSILLVTNLFGMLLPFVLTRFRADPAVASGPLITSIADAIGLVIYFSWAALILTM